MRETFEEFVSVYQFCDPAKQSIQEIIELTSAELQKEFGKGTVTERYWEGEEDSYRKTAPCGSGIATAIVHLDDTADFQGGNLDCPSWPEPPRLGNFGDWIGDPNKPHHPVWQNERGSLFMCKSDRAVGHRTVVSGQCRRLVLELVK